MIKVDITFKIYFRRSFDVYIDFKIDGFLPIYRYFVDIPTDDADMYENHITS